MNKGWILIILLLAVSSCGDKKNNPTEKKQVAPGTFFTAFKALKLPYHIDDSSLANVGDTAVISYEDMKALVPDSALALRAIKKNTEPEFHPIGKIENKTELYLLCSIASGKKTSLYLFLFNNKKKFISALPLINNQNNDGYTHSLDVNTEPTFTVTKTKTINDVYSFTRKGYAFNSNAKSFIEVINETNEDEKKNNEIINPIDTLAKTFKYSGDYLKDKQNFISVRDGNMPGKYLFFLHFERNKEECAGELKGTLSMVDATKAVFQQSGDPCVIDFAFFEKNGIKVKERGSCGNHRGITCLFDDTYKKKALPAIKNTRKK